MNDEVAENIFFYQTIWLLSERTMKNNSSFSKIKILKPLAELMKDLEEKKVVNPQTRGSIVPGLMASSILTSLYNPRETCLNKSVKNYEIRDQILKVSRECVIFNLQRSCDCSSDLTSISKPLITFMTTTKKANQLEYYRSLDWTNVNYIRLDYKKLKYVGLEQKFDPKDWNYSGNEIVYLPALEQWMIPTQFSIDGEKIFPVTFSKSMEILSLEIENLKSQIVKNKMNINLSKQVALGDREILRRKAEIIEIEDQIKFKRSEYKAKLRNVTRGYIFMRPYQYKQLMNRFRESVQKKIFNRINLDEWCFCIVYREEWCNKNFVKRLSDGTSTPMNELITNPIDDLEEDKDGKLKFRGLGISSIYNTTPLPDKFKNLLRLTEQLELTGNIKNNPLTGIKLDVNFTKSQVDPVFLQLLSQVLREKLGIRKEKFFPGNINENNPLKLAFSKTSDGGNWIKEIKRQGDRYTEHVTGPYFDQTEIEKRVSSINNDYSLQGVSRGAHYTFEQIVSKWDIGEESTDTLISRYVESAERYKPPPEAKVFSVMYDLSLVEIVDKNNLRRSFKEVDTLSINKGVISVNSLNHLIYFKRENPESVGRADRLKYVIENEKLLGPDNFIYLYTSLTGRKKRGSPPSILPFSIKSLTRRSCGISIGGLEGMNEEIENVSPSTSFQWLRDNLPVGCLKIIELKRKNILMEVMITDNDTKPKKFKLSNEGDDYFLEIGRENVVGNKIEVMKLKSGDDGDAKLDINFDKRGDTKWNKTRLSLVSGDSFFDTETTLLGLFLLVSKLLGIKEVTLENKKRDSCWMDIKYQYYLIKFLAYGDENMFSEFNFKIQDIENFTILANKIREMELQDFFTEEKIPFRIQKKFRKVLIKEICRIFLEDEKCPSKDETLVVERISNWFDSKIDLVIHSDLRNLDLEMLKNIVVQGWI